MAGTIVIINGTSGSGKTSVARLFAALPAYLIGLRCPLEVLERRGRLRKDRTLGQARLQFDLIHRHTTYDLELDTSRLSSQECAQQIIARLAACLRPSRA
jgi:chloramphenicol 3-O phosphotransferase